MSLKVFTPEAVVEARKARMGTPMAVVFDGLRKNAAKSVGQTAVLAARASKEWNEKPRAERMLELENLRMQIISHVKNQADPPPASTIEDFFGKFYIEVTRRAIEAGDLTPFIAREETNFDFPENVTLRDLLPFRGQMLEVSGSNDPVPLIEQSTGGVDTLTIKSYAVGWKDSLKNTLFNQFFTMDKVVEAAVNAWTDNRNKLTVGVIVGTSYHSSQAQTAVTPETGESLDSQTYRTLRAAIKKIWGLKDPQTDRKIGKRPLTILCNSTDTWQIERVIRGQLEANGGGAVGAIRAALPVGSILEYDQGINDGFTVGKTEMSFAGVAQGVCYLFVPDVAIVANKRALQMESSVGSALELSTEERAWYHCQGEYFKDFLGSSNTPAQGGASGYGFIVKITLPTGD